MKIDKNKVLDKFKNYTDAYDSSNIKVKLKIDHTYRVAGLCRKIAQSENMSNEEQELAWLLGMLHDIGRFEQLRRYNTFMDADSVDHAVLGADILFGNCIDKDAADGARLEIRDYVEDNSEDDLIETAIRQHNVYRISSDLDRRTQTFCNILRDADKIDIFRVCAETPMEDIYNTTHEELNKADVSDKVMESFLEHHATLRSIRRTVVDQLVGHISLVYELVFTGSRAIAYEQGYLQKLMSFESENEKTRACFDIIRKEIKSYVNIS
ncbi:MAG: HD domain-containing protein [Clostridium sp.]|nr:HD domain-containing protein [Clostridium sp.]MCM1400106.1 HD domain-containing protein [Clostridium sp.]MCM1460793.1 HD domain-containing protein [Bacteroides sp.]